MQEQIVILYCPLVVTLCFQINRLKYIFANSRKTFTVFNNTDFFFFDIVLLFYGALISYHTVIQPENDQ